MNHNNHDSKMMWLMMACCLAPVILILFFGVGAKSFGVGTWIILGFLAVYAIWHFIIKKKTGQNKDKKDVESNSDHNSCH
ncbi:MAG: hypothetical protein AAB351_00815 [Patescibacteria group bacterium]